MKLVDPPAAASADLDMITTPPVRLRRTRRIATARLGILFWTYTVIERNGLLAITNVQEGKHFETRNIEPQHIMNTI